MGRMALTPRRAEGERDSLRRRGHWANPPRGEESEAGERLKKWDGLRSEVVAGSVARGEIIAVVIGIPLSIGSQGSSSIMASGPQRSRAHISRQISFVMPPFIKRRGTGVYGCYGGPVHTGWAPCSPGLSGGNARYPGFPFWNPDRLNHTPVCLFLIHSHSMPLPARTQGCLTRPVPPFTTRSNTVTAPTRSVASDASPSFPIPWIGFSPEPCPVHRLFAILDPLLRRAPPVVEPYDRPT
jgi:hypothetical protein